MKTISKERSAEEIKDYYHKVGSDDIMGTVRCELIGRLSFKDAKELLKPDVKRSDWKVLPKDDKSVRLRDRDGTESEGKGRLR